MCGQTLLLFIVIANCAIPVSVSTWRRTGHASQLWYAYLRADGLGKTKRPASTPVEYGHLYLFHFFCTGALHVAITGASDTTVHCYP